MGRDALPSGGVQAHHGLDPVPLRQVVGVLSLSQITSWGCLYYGFAALQASIGADTGWSLAAITGAFSVSQVLAGVVGLWVGRRIDARGPRVVMTASAALALPGMALVALAPTLWWFYLGWAVIGVAVAGTLYPPAFAALTIWGGASRVRALTTVTLAGGLASTVFAPLAAALDTTWGWRAAFGVLAGVAALVTVPLHWWGLRHQWPARHAGAGAGAPVAETTEGESRLPRIEAVSPARSRPFVALGLANTLVALAVYAVVVNTVPMLREQGLDTQTAALVLGLGGLGQVLGRLGYARFAAATSVSGRGVLVVAAVAVLTAGFALAPPVTGVLIAVGMSLGLVRGLYTLVQATSVTDRWGPASYGHLNALLTAPALAASAAAPFLGAVLADAAGSYGNAFLILAAIAALGAALMTATTGRPANRS
ncbi:MFS transporter [Nocardioides rotundus]|uniref:MFS transporter n=1 Tax=Nocardioides rotundus TaxID=1774216 RepID=UPI001CBE70EA|nr:MFS transporter [Nocardioides rotundus]UAL29866.1 MFS transporter [Nocardioides rotundus]